MIKIIFSGASNIVTLNKQFDGNTVKRVCYSGTSAYALDNTNLIASCTGVVQQGGFMKDGSGGIYPFGFYPFDGNVAYAYISSAGYLRVHVGSNWTGTYKFYIDYY